MDEGALIHKTMDTKEKMGEERKENRPLSFSISMILREDEKPKKEELHQVSVASSRVPMATIHHFAPAADNNYIHFGK